MQDLSLRLEGSVVELAVSVVLAQRLSCSTPCGNVSSPTRGRTCISSYIGSRFLSTGPPGKSLSYLKDVLERGGAGGFREKAGGLK